MMPPSASARPRKQFLFVDDDAEFLNVFREYIGELAQGNWSIHLAQNHAQALALLQREKFDVVTVDIGMPVVDGVQFLRLLHRAYPGQQVVMLTGNANDEIRAECTALGASLFLEKPTAPGGFETIYAALDALANTDPSDGFRGLMRRVGLQEVLQLECLGSKSSILEVFTGKAHGRIYIRDGAIIHAEKGSLEGEVALYTLLALRGGEFNLRSFEPPREETINGQWEFLLMEAARLSDEGGLPPEPDFPEPQTSPQLPHTTDTAYFATSLAQTQPTSQQIEEVVLCSGAGEVLYDWQCRSIDRRLELLSQVEEQAAQLSLLAPFGRLERLAIQTESERIICQTLPDRRLFVRGSGGPA